MTMTEPSLDKIWNTDLSFPGVGFGYESAGLAAYINVLRDHLDLVTAAYRVRAEQELARQEADLHELQYRDRLYGIDDAVERQIPRYFYNSAVVAIWGLFESYLVDLSDWVAHRESSTVRLRDLRGPFPDQAVKFFEGVIKFNLPWSKDQRSRLRQLQELRNQIAHRNGRLVDLSEEQERKARDLVAKLPGVTVDSRTIMISAAYVSSSTDMVFDMIGTLNNALAAHYDGPAATP